MSDVSRESLDDWYEALERRHRSDLTFKELRRGLQALSSVYVERRAALNRGAALDGAGKRAAFATFYGPLHFALVGRVVDALGAASSPPTRILDLGCGTGAAGAAWALRAGRRPSLVGIDRNPWGVEEARWTWAWFGLRGTARPGRLEEARSVGHGSAVLLAYTVNELQDGVREPVLERLLESAGRGAQVLVIEPIARRASPWWAEWAGRFEGIGGREDSWRFPAELPEGWRQLDRAAGLDHRELTARTLYFAGAAPDGRGSVQP